MTDSIIKFADEDVCREAIKEIRRDSSENDWCIISYEGTTGPAAQRLKFLAKGSGGVAGMKEHLTDKILAYCLLRTTDQIDESITTKFVFINWLGENAPRMQKSRISIHIGPVKQFFGQFHVDLVASQPDELTHEIIMQKVMDASGSGSRVIDSSTGGKQLDVQSKRAGVATRTTTKVAGPTSDQVTFVPEDELKKLLHDVRQGVDNLQWALLTYEDSKSNNVVFLAKGTGDVDNELKTYLKDDNVCYGIVRKVDKIDESETIKFCFINWVGQNINRMLRARLGTHMGAVKAFFAPFHVDVNAESLNEISDELIVKLIKTTSGTESKVLSDDRTVHTQKIVATKKVSEAPSAAPTPAAAPAAQTPVTSSPAPTRSRPASVYGARALSSAGGASDKIELLFDNEEAVRGGIKSVRDDSNDINWALVTYDAPKSKTLTLVGTGSGGVAELKQHLKDDIVGYALVRLIEVVDQSETVKFCFVNWVGKNINRMQRANLGTHKGFVTELFSPFHVDLDCEDQSEITEEIIYAKIKKAAGTAVYVL